MNWTLIVLVLIIVVVGIIGLLAYFKGGDFLKSLNPANMAMDTAKNFMDTVKTTLFGDQSSKTLKTANDKKWYRFHSSWSEGNNIRCVSKSTVSIPAILAEANANPNCLAVMFSRNLATDQMQYCFKHDLSHHWPFSRDGYTLGPLFIKEKVVLSRNLDTSGTLLGKASDFY